MARAHPPQDWLLATLRTVLAVDHGQTQYGSTAFEVPRLDIEFLVAGEVDVVAFDLGVLIPVWIAPRALVHRHRHTAPAGQRELVRAVHVHAGHHGRHLGRCASAASVSVAEVALVSMTASGAKSRT